MHDNNNNRYSRAQDNVDEALPQIRKIQLRTDLEPAPVDESTGTYPMRNVLESYIKSLESKINISNNIRGGYKHAKEEVRL